MPKLNVNVDHVATVRQARGGNEPDPVLAAHLAELAGAQGIVVHLREDRRHIQERDVRVLRETVRTKLYMEMAPTEEMVRIAAEVKPDMVTLVPEKRQELTTEGGLDVSGNLKAVTASVKALRNSGIPVSLFIDPEAKQISASVKTGADMVEFHTGSYAEAKNEKSAESELNKIKKAVKKALSGGLSVAAGHGLNYVNTGAVARIKGIEEFNIGHSIVSRSLMVGMERAVSDMVKIIG